MKAEIIDNVLVITPSNETELWAFAQWVKESVMTYQHDVGRLTLEKIKTINPGTIGITTPAYQLTMPTCKYLRVADLLQGYNLPKL